VNQEDFSSICKEEMRGQFSIIWDELQASNDTNFASLIGNILLGSQDKIISIFKRFTES
jgi:hypothetical protein